MKEEEIMSNEPKCVKCGKSVFKVQRTALDQFLFLCSSCDEPHTVDAQLKGKEPVLYFWSPKMGDLRR